MNPIWSESQESRVILQESIECSENFEHFLKYLYTGILKLELSNVVHILVGLESLLFLCVVFDIAIIDSFYLHFLV